MLPPDDQARAEVASLAALVASLREICDERLGEIGRLDDALGQLRAIASERGEVIDRLDAALRDALARVEGLVAEIARLRGELGLGNAAQASEARRHESQRMVFERQAAQFEDRIAEKEAEIERLSAELGPLREAAEMRGELLVANEAALAAVKIEADRRAVLLADLTALVEEQARELEGLRVASRRSRPR